MKLSCLENLIKIAVDENDTAYEYTQPRTGAMYPSTGSAYKQVQNPSTGEILNELPHFSVSRGVSGAAQDVKGGVKSIWNAVPTRQAVWNALPSRQEVGRFATDIANTAADTAHDVVSPVAWGGNGLFNLLTQGQWNGLYGPFGSGDTSRLTDGLATVPLAFNKVNNRINTGVDRIVDSVNGTTTAPIFEKARNAQHQALQDSLYSNQGNRRILSGVEDAQAEAYESLAALIAGGMAGRAASAVPAASTAARNAVPFLMETPYQAGINPSYSATHDRFGKNLGNENEYYTPWIHEAGNMFKFMSPLAGGERYHTALEPLMYGITTGGGIGNGAISSDAASANQKLQPHIDAPLARAIDDAENGIVDNQRMLMQRQNYIENVMKRLGGTNSPEAAQQLSDLQREYSRNHELITALEGQRNSMKMEAAGREWEAGATAAAAGTASKYDWLMSALFPVLGESRVAQKSVIPLAVAGSILSHGMDQPDSADLPAVRRDNLAPYTSVLPNSVHNSVPIYASE